MNDVIEFHIGPKLDNKTLASFAMTCRDWRKCFKPEICRRRQLRRREIIRCARIYKYLPVAEEPQIDIGIFFPGCSPEETWVIHKVQWDCWFRIGPDPIYEHHDPDAWYYITEDMKMGAPHDAPLIYNFYMKVIKDRGLM